MPTPLEVARDYVRDELKRLEAKAAGDEGLTDDEWTAVRDGLAYVKDADAKIETQNELHRAVEAGHVERGDGATIERKEIHTIVRPSADDVFDVRSLDNLGRGSREYVRKSVDLAMRAIDTAPGHMTAEQKECAERIARTSTPRDDKARWILEHGSPEYHEAFYDYLQTPQLGPTQGRADRAAMSLTGANGGYLVPFTLDPTIILTNNGATNPFRSICSQVSITTDDWNGVSSAGVTAEWIAEATQVADATPTFSQPTITVYKADAYIQASMEVVADSGVSGEISMLIADAKDRLEAAAFAVGSGSGRPHGIVTELGLVTASRVAGSSGAAGAADFVLADVYAVANALPPRYRPNSSWVAEQTNLNKIRRFGEGSVGAAAFWADLNVDTPPLLLGRPVYESSEMDSTIVSGSNDDVLVLGDFRHGYKIVDRMGLELVFNPLVLSTNANRPTGEVAWVAFWRVGGRAVDANAFRMLRL